MTNRLDNLIPNESTVIATMGDGSMIKLKVAYEPSEKTQPLVVHFPHMDITLNVLDAKELEPPKPL